MIDHVIVPSVNYADTLKVVLPQWFLFADRQAFWIVTSPEDADTMRVAEHFGVNCHVTRAWHEGGAKFDKARAIDEVYERVSEGAVCVSTDGDIWPEGQLPNRVEPDTIYGAVRFDVHSAGELEARYEGRLVPRSRTLDYKQHVDRWQVCTGSFQLFRFSPARRFGTHPDAGWYDYRFALGFDRGLVLPNFKTYHLGLRGKNWKGRVTKPWA